MGIAGFGLDVGNLHRLLSRGRASERRSGLDGTPGCAAARQQGPAVRRAAERLETHLPRVEISAQDRHRRCAWRWRAWLGRPVRVRRASRRSRAGHRRSRSAAPAPRRVSFSGPRWLREGVQHAFSPSFRSNEDHERGVGSSPPCETRSPRRHSHWSLPGGRSPSPRDRGRILTEPHRENPITGIAACCACAASGHAAAAPPTNVMKSRRFTNQCLPRFRL